MGLSDRADYLGPACWIVSCRSRFSRASNFGNQDPHRLDRCTGILLLAEVRCYRNESDSCLRHEIYLYASKIRNSKWPPAPRLQPSAVNALPHRLEVLHEGCTNR